MLCLLLAVRFLLRVSIKGTGSSAVMFDAAFREHDAWELAGALQTSPRSALSDGTGLTAQFGGSTNSPPRVFS